MQQAGKDTKLMISGLNELTNKDWPLCASVLLLCYSPVHSVMKCYTDHETQWGKFKVLALIVEQM